MATLSSSAPATSRRGTLWRRSARKTLRRAHRAANRAPGVEWVLADRKPKLRCPLADPAGVRAEAGGDLGEGQCLAVAQILELLPGQVLLRSCSRCAWRDRGSGDGAPRTGPNGDAEGLQVDHDLAVRAVPQVDGDRTALSPSCT